MNHKILKLILFEYFSPGISDNSTLENLLPGVIDGTIQLVLDLQVRACVSECVDA